MIPVVKKRNHEAKKSMDKRDGTKTNPVISCYDELWLGFAREITAASGFDYVRHKVHSAQWNHSYQWIPIMSNSPVASRTRVKFKNSL